MLSRGRVLNSQLLPPLAVGLRAVYTSVFQQKVPGTTQAHLSAVVPKTEGGGRGGLEQLVTLSSFSSAVTAEVPSSKAINPQLQQRTTEVSLQGLLCKNVVLKKCLMKINVCKFCGN